MKFIKKFDHYITAIFVITIIVIIATSYFTFKEFFNASHQKQQEVVMPLFSLIHSEIIRPLTVSQYMATDPFLLDYIEQDKIDRTVIIDYITSVSNQFNTMTFIAIEKHQLLFDTNNKTTSLSVKEAEWYHRLKAIDQTEFTDFGDAEDPHLFFDVKMFNKQQDFIGFIGLAIDLDHFANKFSKFKEKHGFKLYFVDNNNDITLSSEQIMQTMSHHRKDVVTNINELPWYNQYQSNNDTGSSQYSFGDSSNELIISQMPLKELNWRVFIIAPPITEQSVYWQLFMQNLIIFIFVSLALYYLFTLCINNFRSDLVKDSETDYLTQLPNRSFIHWKYSQLNEEYEHVSVVIADIDNFKILNDTYGHLFGDDVLKIIATKLSENLRSIDLAGRWGGEEFIIILPDTNAKQAQEIINRIRKNIANIPFTPSSTSKELNVTVSFGISDSNLTDITLEEILEKADQALYSAKTNGRNQVVIHLE
ncbi:sensor domain-containing diguanylate cyclase [Candidatus Colwellia aromaticivorans]|uniref:sensor domain-containing diguanylate cyclase n=1 Tax=Candidatus Colwellia aromaticivorans TaxID=2267621 RepID=UPI000DF2B539|nr:sensor domain-containing diguanylate cyclase [Candidatus Colwellia aromaticivorans]